MRRLKQARLTRECREKALEAGMYQRSDGRIVPLGELHDSHLVNALLKALVDGESRGITELLAAEVGRRHLEEYAQQIAAAREQAKLR